MGLKFVQELPQDEIAPRSKHAENAQELRENPGVWAQIGEYSKRASATSMVSDITKGKQSAYADKNFEAEAVSKNVGEDNEKHYVYARYNGPAVVAETDVDTDEDGGDEGTNAPAFSG